MVGLELVVVLNLEYGNLLRGIDNCSGERYKGRIFGHIFCKSWGFFQVEIKKIVVQGLARDGRLKA